MTEDTGKGNSPSSFPHAGGEAGIMNLRCDNWISAAWNSHDLQASYMRDVGNYQLLSPQDEAHWAQQFSDARHQMRVMINRFPQVLIAKLKDLRDNPEAQRLNYYLDLEPADDEDSVSEDSIEQLDLNVINEILDNSPAIIRHFEQRNAHPEHYAPNGEEAPSQDQFIADIFAPYLHDVGKVRFQQRFYSECVDLFISGKWQAPGVSEAERSRLCADMKEVSRQAVEAMNMLVEGNLRLVISIARRYVCSLMPLADLVQEGNIGLMRAVETFEYKLGHRFSTYASYWIRQAISRALNSNGRSIRMPVNILRQLSKIRRCEREFLQQKGNLPTVEELSAATELPVPRVRALQKMALQPISLQSIATEDRDWNELLADERTEPAHDDYAMESLRDSLKMALDTLEEREREILIRRFGLMGHSIETLEQIAQRFKLTSERIRQLEAIALRKLRKPESNRYLDDLRS